MITENVESERNRMRANGLNALKHHLQYRVGVSPRTLTDVEIFDLLEDLQRPESSLGRVMVFPLPVPEWSGEDKGATHVVRTWAWCTEHQLLVLAAIPEDMPVIGCRNMAAHLNGLVDFSGRFFATSSGLCYLNVQLLPIRPNNVASQVVELESYRFHNDAMKDHVFLSLATVVHDLSLCIHLIRQRNCDEEVS